MNVITRYHRDGSATVSLQSIELYLNSRPGSRRNLGCRQHIRESRTFAPGTDAAVICRYIDALHQKAAALRQPPKANTAAPKQTHGILP